jgi:CDP-glycerol glycerophosphotransferase (TagB/SpsB family)
VQNNIRTISIIEHWSLYRKRFEVNGQYIYPDMIFVNDEQAKKDAINDGIPESKLYIVGNPVLENTTKYKYSINDRLKWRSGLGISKESKIVTFISESFKADFQEGSPEFQGFDEFDVLNDILEALNNESILIVKLHPAESRNKYDFLTKNSNIFVVGDMDINKLIEFSDILIGMGSMLLMEASMIRNTVYSYRPNEKIEFIGNKNGMVKKIHNKMELKEKLSNYEIENFSVTNNIFNGSTRNIVNLIQKSL